MTIHSLTGKPPQNNPLTSKSTLQEKSQSVDKKPAIESEPTVSVDITEIAKKITEAFESSSKDTPAVNEGRVQAIKAAVLEGTYPINAEVIAEKMMQMEQQTFNSR